jgi:Cu+-exporting ATPase
MTEDHMATTDESPITDGRRLPPQVQRSTDPVCGMQVVGADESLTIDYKGHIYQFCSTTCRDTFRADPEKFT